MSTEDQSPCSEKNLVLSSSAQENHVGEQGNQSTLFLGSGNEKITDLTNSSAAQLLKTIVIASHTAGQQHNLASLTETPPTMENPLPQDLQSFKGDPFVHILNKTQNGQQLQQQQQQQQQQPDQQQNAQFVVSGLSEMNTTPTNFNGVNTNLFNDFVNSHTSKTVGEGLNVNTDQNSIKNNSEMPTFESLNTPQQHSPDYSIEKSGVLHRLLSGENIAERGLRVSIPSGSFTVTSPTDYSKSSPSSSANSPYGDSNLSPFGENTETTTYMDTDHSGFKDIPKTVNISDTTTQSSLITHTGNLQLDSRMENNIENDVKYDMACEWDVTKLDENLDRKKTGKVPRLHQDSDASSALSPSVDNVFRAEGAQQEVPSDFTFQMFGQGETDQGTIGVFPGIVSGTGDVSPSQHSPPLSSPAEQPFKTPQTLPHNVVKQQRERLRRAKEPILSQAFPAKIHGYEIRILQQPEEQHRARYLTEGSRGSVKNRNGTAYPQVKLFGHTGEATLQVFIGNDSGRVRPHGFYQACKVCGKNSTMCTEKDIDGTTVIEIELQSGNDMTAAIDCVGILKLRNADVEQRIGIAKAKKKSTKARMIFRVTFQKPCGNPQVLQVASSTILCTQPVGQPEICKMSLKECSMAGGEELYIIGKNFLRGTHILFQQASEDESGITVWQKEGEIDKDYFQTTHMIVTVPEYGGTYTGEKVECQVVVNSGGKLSDPQPIFYKPVDHTTVTIKQDVMDTVEESRKRNYPFVAPEALELNQQIQQVQQVSNNSEMFQLPPGIISGMPESGDLIPMEQGTREGNQSNEMTTNENLAENLGKEETQSSNFSLEQKVYGQESADTNQTWNSEQNSVQNIDSEKNELNVELNSLNYSSMNTEEFDENQINNSFVHIKSPRLSNEGLFTEHIGMPNTAISKEDSVVSQFLQNISMALKESDPMFSGNETVSSKLITSLTLTAPTTVNTHLLMAANSQQGQQSKNMNEKPQTIEHSFLKEALTCPPASLQHQNIHTLAGQNAPLFVPKTEADVSGIDMQIDNSNSEVGHKTEEVMEYNPTVSEISSTSPAPGVPFETPAPPTLDGTLQFSESNAAATYSLGLATQNQQTGMPFSPSHVLTSWNTSQTLNADTKPILNLSGGRTTNTVHGSTHHMSDLTNTYTLEKTIMSSMVQDHIKTAGLQQSMPVSMEHHQHPVADPHASLVQQLKNPARNQPDSINAILQQLLSQAAVPKQEQQQFVAPQQHGQQFQQQQQIETGNGLQQQQQLYSDQQLQQQQQLFQQDGQNQSIAQQQQQQHYQQPQDQQHQQQQHQQQQQALQQQFFQQANLQQTQKQQQQSLPTPAANPLSAISPGQTNSGQQPVLTSVLNQSQNPVAPQIIICNNPTTGTQLPQTQFGSPSIVIVPGQAGPNNQVENLLRSILGSMMQPQQQQQPQQQENQQHASP